MEKFMIRPQGSTKWYTPRQPISGTVAEVEKTYTADSGRNYAGEAIIKVQFMVEKFTWEVRDLTLADCALLAQLVMGRDNELDRFEIHYVSAYYGGWRDAWFYVGKGSFQIGQVNNNTGIIDKVSFNCIGVYPVTRTLIGG